MAPVPLFIKRPFQRHGRVIDRPVQTIDILPTVVDVLELSRTWSDLDGESVYAPRLERDHSRRLDRFELTSEGHEKYEAVARKYELFGRHGSLNLFAVAPAGLVGLLDERVGPTTPIEATSSPSPVTLFQDGHRLLPILRGRLAGVAQGASVLIAAAVNGRVIGITRSYDGVEGEYFYFMVPPHAVGAALRGLSLYQVDTRVASGERLVPLEVRVTDLID